MNRCRGWTPSTASWCAALSTCLIGEGATQLLFVSHHAEDAPACITHRLAFVPEWRRVTLINSAPSA